MSDGVELATDCREAGFMTTKTSATTATTAATAAKRAATLNSAARSKSRARLAGSLVAIMVLTGIGAFAAGDYESAVPALSSAKTRSATTATRPRRLGGVGGQSIVVMG